MKFAGLIVLFAIVLASECAVVQIVPGLSYTAVQGPSLVAVAPAAVASPAIATIRGPAAVPLITAPATVAIASAPTVVAAAPVVTAEGSYVAQTRGAVHVAPLPGHANSAASVNLEPAPGTA